MTEFISKLFENTLVVTLLYGTMILIIIILYFFLKKKYIGTFHEANIFRRLKRLYMKSDYPFIREIILPFNKENYAYYDAIVFGDRFIYVLEIKNQPGILKIAPVNDWLYVDNTNKEHPFLNAFYELNVRKLILNRFLDVHSSRIIEVVIYNNKTTVVGDKGSNHLINYRQIVPLIKQYEKRKEFDIIDPRLIEKMGNGILDYNIRNRKIRNTVINDLKSQRCKR